EAGRLNDRSLGIYSDAHVPRLREIAAFCRSQGARVGIQLGHAGPKAWSKTQGRGPLRPASPSGHPFDDGWVVPSMLSTGEIELILEDWRAAARRAVAAEFDFVEVHAAHGYLLNSFLSPLTNRREDVYGRDRTRLLFESIAAVRSEIPASMPLFVRLSVDDLASGGWTSADSERLAIGLGAAGVDALDLSWGGITPTQLPSSVDSKRLAARRVRLAGGLPVVAVGLVESAAQAEETLVEEIADIVAIGRLLVHNPYWTIEAAETLADGTPPAIVSPYLAAR
ncbi:MAG: oxidoreductase, partial [bacterium]|nr:oxidoreductase [bacterium]